VAALSEPSRVKIRRAVWPVGRSTKKVYISLILEKIPLYFTHVQRSPQWTDLHKILHRGSSRGPNCQFQILCQHPITNVINSYSVSFNWRTRVMSLSSTFHVHASCFTVAVVAKSSTANIACISHRTSFSPITCNSLYIDCSKKTTD